MSFHGCHVRPISGLDDAHKPTIGARTAMSARTCSKELAAKAVRAPFRQRFKLPNHVKNGTGAIQGSLDQRHVLDCAGSPALLTIPKRRRTASISGASYLGKAGERFVLGCERIATRFDMSCKSRRNGWIRGYFSGASPRCIALVNASLSMKMYVG